MATLVEWLPPNNGETFPFTTGASAPARLLALEGLEPVTVQPIGIKSPNQPGDTTVDIVVPGRVVVLAGLLQAESVAALWDARSTLSRSFAQQPTRLGETYELGRLRVTLDDRPALELDAVPRSVSIMRPHGTKALAPFDLEFYCPSPYWRETADSQITLGSAEGGFGFPPEFPLEMPTYNVEQEIENAGDVDAPITARIYGDVTTARLINQTTGETLEITGNLPATKYWEITTGFGQKAVREYTIADGTYVSAMEKINLDAPDFWSLRPGANLVSFEADVNTSGYVEVSWRQRYSGF